jgi:hypothetical protein
MSHPPSARDRNEPGKGDLDDELDGLIAAYRELHKDDDRLRRIERTTCVLRPAADDPAARVAEHHDEQIAPALQTQDARRVAAGILRTEEDVRAYAARFVQDSTVADPAGKDLDRQAHAVDATGTQWLVMVGQNRDHGLVACRFVRVKGIPHARMVSFTAQRLPLPIVVVELGPDSPRS